MTEPANDARQRARAAWAAGDWNRFAPKISSVGQLVLDRVGVEPGVELLDVGTGSGGTVAIPAALRGARVVGLDVTPELLEHARRRAAEAGVEVEWIEGDAAELPFADASFDRVTSTFGAMFAPDHARRGGGARARLPARRADRDDDVGQRRLRRRDVHAPGAYMPPPPPGTQTPPTVGASRRTSPRSFGAAGADPDADDGDGPSSALRPLPRRCASTRRTSVRS